MFVRFCKTCMCPAMGPSSKVFITDKNIWIFIYKIKLKKSKKKISRNKLKDAKLSHSFCVFKPELICGRGGGDKG